MDGSPQVALQQPHYGTEMPGAGAVHPIRSDSMEQMYRDHRIVTERDGEKWVVRIRRLDGEPITVHGISHPELSTAECPDAISAIVQAKRDIDELLTDRQ